MALQVLADSLNDSPVEVPRQGSGGRGKGTLRKDEHVVIFSVILWSSSTDVKVLGHHALVAGTAC